MTDAQHRVKYNLNNNYYYYINSEASFPVGRLSSFPSLRKACIASPQPTPVSSKPPALECFPIPKPRTGLDR
ncbi:hypothetical protein HPB47_012246 [Ixodes persulcatus]|uniref:Uncharacterized protein n=1 Tax=Ixodes persulcatus TaxID=34615 RepID=A0AC60NU56_IXOPE|nr:hypothetical protein HPB47_012246 [Ixodes persulcatus]